MTTRPPGLQRTIVAYLAGADRVDQPTNIHTDVAAQRLGYRGALVYGTTVYAWGVPLIVEAMGEAWLRDGWLDLSVRRPVYAGDRLRLAVEPGGQGRAAFTAHNDAGFAVVAAYLGRGRGEWLADHCRSRRIGVEPPPDPKPGITLETAPVGADLPHLQAEVHDRLATMFEEATAHGATELHVEGSRIQSPAAITGRMTWYVHAVWEYGGPALHARSLVQYLDVAGYDEPLSVAGHLRSVFERNGHHYLVVDGIVLGADGREVALTRHHSIFKVAQQANRQAETGGV